MNRVAVTGGGEPTQEELAAIVVALTPARPADAPDDPAPPGWARAAILEGVGARPVTSAADLTSRAPWTAP